MTYRPHTLPALVAGFVSSLSDQQLVDGVRKIDSLPSRSAEEQQSRIWLINAFENRHPEIHDQVLEFFDIDAPDTEMGYIDILASVTPGVN